MAALERFTWCTQSQGGGGGYTSSNRVREIKFGGGLRQVASAGFNTKVRTFNIVYAGKDPELGKVEDFLDRHTIKPFAWTTPRGDLGVFTVAADSISGKPLGGGKHEISCQFVEFYM